jgi:hypothetical protein
MGGSVSLEQHLSAFAEAFVAPARRERWKYLLVRRSKGAFRDSSKLMDHLDTRFCVQVDGAFGVPEDTQGAFYDFHDEPRLMSLREAIQAGQDNDALFSAIPGKLAIHWSHEGWSWLCRR